VRALKLQDKVSFIRNNVDHYTGATFGCHENYLMKREAQFTPPVLGTLLAIRFDQEERAALRLFLRALRRYDDAAVFVAELPMNGIVGRLSLGRDPHPASRHVADLGLMVSERHRRRGIGTALLREAEEWARTVGVRKLELHVFPHNDAAIHLYESVGFRREGLRRGHYRRGEEYLDAVLMALDVH
jgi:RimJ/RimL family protein N-acetyltransferase